MLVDKDAVMVILDSVKAQMDALPDLSASDVESLKAQIVDLEKKNEELVKSLALDEAKIEAAKADLNA